MPFATLYHSAFVTLETSFNPCLESQVAMSIESICFVAIFVLQAIVGL